MKNFFFLRTRWVGYVARRYISGDRKNSPSAIFSVLGIATGVLALIVIIAVMNGFQLGFIESILEISSGHLRVENLPAGPAADELENRIRALPGITSAMLFRETSVLVRGKVSGVRGAVLRGLPVNALTADPGLAGKLEMESGTFDLSSPDNIVLGTELARMLSVRPGDTVTVLAVSGGLFGQEEGNGYSYKVTGIFSCGYYEYDLGWAFINIDRAAMLAGPGEKPVLSIKLKDRWQDRQFMAAVEKIIVSSADPMFASVSVSSWRDYNRSFFSALRTEKLMMFILVGLIFIVVGLNIFQSQRRSVLERREEIGMLRALGASDIAVRFVFILDGVFIGLTGAVIGLIAGLLLAFNIPAFFSFLEKIANLFISAVNVAADFLGSGEAGSFNIFSPAVFYIREIPSRVIPHEVVLIFLFGFLSAVVAAWFASGRVSRTRPAEVLRYE
ncbi:MAG: ABC transporter permease [Treponema sp.]|nr:ABC transporter permease [Treponema sp.]